MRKHEALRNWFEKQKDAFQFIGKQGESHRVFVLSADTFGKECAEPWRCTSRKESDLAALLFFMMDQTGPGQTGPAPVLLYFDGRNKHDRKCLAAAVEARRNLCEVWLTYRSTRRLGRRVAWGSDSREIGWISLPLCPAELHVKERGATTSMWGRLRTKPRAHTSR